MKHLKQPGRKLGEGQKAFSVFADLSVVASVQSHPVLPEVLEEGRQDLGFDVVCFHAVSATTLLHHLRDKTRRGAGERFFGRSDRLANVTNGCRARTERTTAGPTAGSRVGVHLADY